jgi:hypothetical protein
MASDHRYYKRHNFKSVPMEDYEVRDVARRSAGPLLGVVLVFDQVESPDAPAGKLPRAALRFLLTNEGREPATAARVEVGIDARAAVVAGPVPWRNAPQMGHQSANGFIIARQYSFNWGGPNAFPIFEGAPASVGTMVVEPLLDAGTGPFLVPWRVLAPKAAPINGWSFFGWDIHGSSFQTSELEPHEVPGLEGVHWYRSDAEGFRATAELVARQDLPRYRNLRPR